MLPLTKGLLCETEREFKLKEGNYPDGLLAIYKVLRLLLVASDIEKPKGIPKQLFPETKLEDTAPITLHSGIKLTSVDDGNEIEQISFKEESSPLASVLPSGDSSPVDSPSAATEGESTSTISGPLKLMPLEVSVEIPSPVTKTSSTIMGEMSVGISSPLRDSSSEVTTEDESDVSLLEVRNLEKREEHPSSDSEHSDEDNEDLLQKASCQSTMSESQLDLQETFRTQILPLFNEFVARAKKKI